MIRQPYPTPRAADSTFLRTRTPNWTPRPTERTTAVTQDNLRVTYCGNAPPSDGLQAAVPKTAKHSVHTAPRQIPNITPPCRSAATNLQTLQQSPTAHAHSPAAGPYAPNRTTPPSGALTLCDDLRSLNTGRVPGQPGLARPPVPQDHNREGDTKAPSTNTPDLPSASPPRPTH